MAPASYPCCRLSRSPSRHRRSGRAKGQSCEPELQFRRGMPVARQHLQNRLQSALHVLQPIPHPSADHLSYLQRIIGRATVFVEPTPRS